MNAPVRATPPMQSPPPVRNKGQEPSDSDLPGQMPSTPYLQIARNDPRPYEDPAMKKTTVQRIKEIQERLKGFLAFKAQLISDRSDPQIQMPLSSARADFDRLSSTLNVLSRNPEMSPTQSEQQMDEIDDNLAYLNQEAEKIQALSPGQEMPAPLKPSIFEGFADSGKGIEICFENPSMALPSPPPPPPPPPSHSNYSYPSTVSAISSNSEAPSQPNDHATLQELNNFLSRVENEKRRLSSSGTTDPLITARIAGLDRITSDVTDILNRVQNKQMQESEIPIKKSDIQNALTSIQQGSIPQFLSTTSANSAPYQAMQTALAGLMPGILNMPKSAMQRIMDNIKISLGINYTDTLGGLAQSLGLPGVNSSAPSESNKVAPPLPNPATNETFTTELYDSKNNQEIDGITVGTYTGFTEEQCKKVCNGEPTCDGYNFHRGNSLDPVCTLKRNPKGYNNNLYVDSAMKVMTTSEQKLTQGFQNILKPQTKSPLGEAAPFTLKGGECGNRNPMSKIPIKSKAQFPMRTTEWTHSPSANVGNFDWHERSKQIVDQIRKRGMNPREFGALVEGAHVSNDYDWKGYSAMLCNRLEASYDTGLAVACGCPTTDWPGWHIPKRS